MNAMRQIVLDTETTGLEARDGHRIIEIGAIELVGRRLTERRFHRYCNPQRDSDPGALAVHGLTREFLSDKPLFADILPELVAFLEGAEVIIHNAAFDVSFLDAEFARAGRPNFAAHCATVTDSLRLARELHPGKRNSLDALCERYSISNRHRTLHGALIDAALLGDVYLAMTRGQDSLVMELAAPVQAADAAPVAPEQLIVLEASAAERAAHEAVLDAIEKETRKPSVWRRAPEPPPAPAAQAD
jgi:DNA polymerase-3 subunit epsilon